MAAFSTDESMPVVELAVALERRGFESLFLTEHSHMPLHGTPYPGGELPRHYSRTLDPFTALGAAAAVTSDLLLGTGVCLVSARDPIHLAKQVATVDVVSGGRFLFGVGAGWNLAELANHGTAADVRWMLVRERIEAMKAIWADEIAEFHGRLVDFDPMRCWPKPLQEPHPPILVAGTGSRAFERVVAYGDGWLPIYRQVTTPWKELVSILRTRAADAGRHAPSVTVFWAPADQEALDELADAGVERALLELPTADAAATLATLDEWAPLAASSREHPGGGDA